MLKKRILIFLLFCNFLALGQEKNIDESKKEKEIIEVKNYKFPYDDKIEDYNITPDRENTFGKRHYALWDTFDEITELRGEYPSLIQTALLGGGSVKITGATLGTKSIKPEDLLDAMYKTEWKGSKIKEYNKIVKEESKDEISIFEDEHFIYYKKNIDTPKKISKNEKNYKYSVKHGKYKNYYHTIDERRYIEEIFTDEEGEYFFGFKEGEWIVRDMNGKTEKYQYLNGRKHGKYINEKNQVFQYVNGFKHGKWIETENGVTKEILYEYGKPIKEKIIKKDN